MHKKKFKKICTQCQREYMAATDKSRFCSRNCEKTAYYKRVKQQSIKTEPKKIEYIAKICKHCKCEFQCETYKTNKIFCTSECRDDYYRYCRQNGFTPKDEKELEALKVQVSLKVKEIILKANNGTGDTYNNSIIDYRLLSDMPLETRKDVLERDHNKCQICNSRGNLHIHHIIQRRNGGNHNIDNLITLCGSCHRHIEIGDIDYAIEKCFENAKRNYFSNGVVNTLERYEIIDRLTEIFNEVKNNYTNCNNLLISIDELIEQI